MKRKVPCCWPARIKTAGQHRNRGGDEGRPASRSGKRKGAKGLAHILEARMRKDGYSEQEAIRFLGDMVETIARGAEVVRTEIGRSIKVRIEKGDSRVFH